MSEWKQFKATPIHTGKRYRKREVRAERLRTLKRAGLVAGVGLTIVLGCVWINHAAQMAVVNRAWAETPTDAGNCYGLSVHDGDTIRCGAERIRIENIDAPELEGSPKCQDYRRSYAWCDFEKGIASRDELKAFLGTGTVRISRHGMDKYGRTLARVTVNGRDAGNYLIGEGLARAWR